MKQQVHDHRPLSSSRICAACARFWESRAVSVGSSRATRLPLALGRPAEWPICCMARRSPLCRKRRRNQLLVQTWQVEEGGGLLTTDGTNRRRTQGGVFLWLVKQRLSEVERAKVFSVGTGARSRPGVRKQGAAAAQGE